MNRIRGLLLSAIPLLLITACMAANDKPTVVILKNEQTMDFQECRVADWGSEKGFRDNDDCVKAYQRQGYVVWGSR